jgi:hypothetical protein
MITKAALISVGCLGIATSALAAGFTERLQTDRMTVAQIDQARARFLCAEHRRWNPVPTEDLIGLGAGDIVMIERLEGRVAKVRVVRTAAEEMGSPER